MHAGEITPGLTVHVLCTDGQIRQMTVGDPAGDAMAWCWSEGQEGRLVPIYDMQPTRSLAVLSAAERARREVKRLQIERERIAGLLAEYEAELKAKTGE